MAGPDPIFDVHAQALALQRQRMDVLAANIANADTPNYKARDIDFAQQLRQTLQGGAEPAASHHARHIPLHSNGASGLPGQAVYRVALQASVDGNTVDTQVEQAQFADAALHSQASLGFADARLRALMTALTGQ